MGDCLGHGCCMPWPWLLYAHWEGGGGLPWPWLLHALATCLGLGCCMGGCLGLGCRMPWPWLLHAHELPWPWLRAHGGLPWPWLHAHGGQPRPWLLHAHGGLPRPWLHALALALGGCHGLGQGNEGFLEKEVNCPKEAGIVHGKMPRGMHAKPYRPASSRTLKKLARAFFCFCVPKFIP